MDPLYTARERIAFSMTHEKPDDLTMSVEELLRDTDIVKQIVALGECVTRVQVIEQIRAAQSLRALKGLS